MSIAGIIADRLVLDQDVAALVGARVYQLKLPQAPRLPAVRVQLIAEPLTYHLRGDSGIRRAVVQVDSFASETDAGNPEPYVTVDRLANLVDAALSGAHFRAAGGSPPLDAIYEVQGMFRENRVPIYEAPEFRVVRMMQEYAVWYRRFVMVMV